MQLTEECREEVDKIKKLYNFKENFDLLAKLNHLPTAIALRPLILRSADEKKHLNNLIKCGQKFIEALRDTPAQTKININQIPEELIKIGYKDIRNKISDWSISEAENHLAVLNSACIFAQQKILPDVGGREKNSTPQYVIFNLAAIYHSGTGKHPTCSWTKKTKSDVGKYSGEFYEFILHLEPLLNVLGCLHEFSLFKDNIPLVKGKLYLREQEGKIVYSIIAPDGHEINDILLAHIKAPLPFTLNELTKLKISILTETAKKGHTLSINLGTNKTIGTHCVKILQKYRDIIKENYAETL